jgi:hypothetical protein
MATPFELRVQGEVVAALVTLVVATLFVYFAARLVIDRSSLLASVATVVLGTLLGGFVAAFVSGILGVVLAAAAWALVAAVFFRTAWVKGAIIGLVAWVLWAIVRYVVALLT